MRAHEDGDGTNQSIIVMNVYRPGSANADTQFYEELSTVSTMLEALVEYAVPVVVGGDFNIHVDSNNTAAGRLADLLASFNMIQHVHATTHRCGHTLDLVITPAQWPLDGDVTVERTSRPNIRSFPGRLSNSSCWAPSSKFLAEVAYRVAYRVGQPGWTSAHQTALRFVVSVANLTPQCRRDNRQRQLVLFTAQ